MALPRDDCRRIIETLQGGPLRSYLSLEGGLLLASAEQYLSSPSFGDHVRYLLQNQSSITSMQRKSLEAANAAEITNSVVLSVFASEASVSHAALLNSVDYDVAVCLRCAFAVAALRSLPSTAVSFEHVLTNYAVAFASPRRPSAAEIALLVTFDEDALSSRLDEALRALVKGDPFSDDYRDEVLHVIAKQSAASCRYLRCALITSQTLPGILRSMVDEEMVSLDALLQDAFSVNDTDGRKVELFFRWIGREFDEQSGQDWMKRWIGQAFQSNDPLTWKRGLALAGSLSSPDTMDGYLQTMEKVSSAEGVIPEDILLLCRLLASRPATVGVQTIIDSLENKSFLVMAIFLRGVLKRGSSLQSIRGVIEGFLQIPLLEGALKYLERQNRDFDFSYTSTDLLKSVKSLHGPKQWQAIREIVVDKLASSRDIVAITAASILEPIRWEDKSALLSSFLRGDAGRTASRMHFKSARAFLRYLGEELGSTLLVSALEEESSPASGSPSAMEVEGGGETHRPDRDKYSAVVSAAVVVAEDCHRMAVELSAKETELGSLLEVRYLSEAIMVEALLCGGVLHDEVRTPAGTYFSWTLQPIPEVKKLQSACKEIRKMVATGIKALDDNTSQFLLSSFSESPFLSSIVLLWSLADQKSIQFDFETAISVFSPIFPSEDSEVFFWQTVLSTALRSLYDFLIERIRWAGIRGTDGVEDMVMSLSKSLLLSVALLLRASPTLPTYSEFHRGEENSSDRRLFVPPQTIILSSEFVTKTELRYFGAAAIGDVVRRPECLRLVLEECVIPHTAVPWVAQSSYDASTSPSIISDAITAAEGDGLRIFYILRWLSALFLSFKDNNLKTQIREASLSALQVLCMGSFRTEEQEGDAITLLLELCYTLSAHNDLAYLGAHIVKELQNNPSLRLKKATTEGLRLLLLNPS